MKVRIKEEKTYFIYGSLRPSGEELTLVPVEHSTQKDEKGNPYIITPEKQFSEKCMELVEERKKPGPKPKEA